MLEEKNIPELKFHNIHKKDLEFEIVSNWEVLDKDSPLKHNPFIPHRIRFYSLLFILKGEGYHYIDFKKYSYKRGSIIFISKEQVHAFEKNLDRDAYFMVFTEDFLERSSMGSSLMHRLSLYNYHLYPPTIQLQEEQIPIFENLVTRIRHEYHQQVDHFTEELIQSSLKIFLFLAERIRRKSRDLEEKSVYHETFLQFQKLVQDNVLENRKVSFYANEMASSTKKLNRAAHHIVDQTAKEFIKDQLIIEMKRLLMNTSFSIKEIAYRTGFGDPTNFIKYFKKDTDMTPSDFRKDYF
jgi:AraC family transcriptional activator of pobA